MKLSELQIGKRYKFTNLLGDDDDKRNNPSGPVYFRSLDTHNPEKYNISISYGKEDDDLYATLTAHSDELSMLEGQLDLFNT